ncbi:hypothetical protein LTR04_000714 [Oleoguttula sp. CCFEE 6159]|nr:hypothetical protein LTR04_000714 [Oleoguttula sp. CCFEE 6159]
MSQPSTRATHPRFNADPARQSLSNIAFILAALTAGGGTMGYVRTGSVPSVAAGCTVGALYALGGYRISARQPYGVELALLASVVLAGSSIPRAMRSGKPLPIGLSLLAMYGLFNFGMAWRNGVAGR